MKEKLTEYLPALKIEFSLMQELNKLLTRRKGGRGVRGGRSEFIRQAIRTALKKSGGNND